MRISPLGIQFYFFALAFAASYVAMWTTLVINKEYVVFMDAETVPAPTDVFVPLLGESPGEPTE